MIASHHVALTQAANTYRPISHHSVSSALKLSSRAYPYTTFQRREKYDIQITRKNENGEVDLRWEVSYSDQIMVMPDNWRISSIRSVINQRIR